MPPVPSVSIRDAHPSPVWQRDTMPIHTIVRSLASGDAESRRSQRPPCTEDRQSEPERFSSRETTGSHRAAPVPLWPCPPAPRSPSLDGGGGADERQSGQQPVTHGETRVALYVTRMAETRKTTKY
jgi:hypothetical protein